MGRGPRALSVAVAVSLTLLLGACGDDGGSSPEAKQAVLAAIDRVEAAGTAVVELESSGQLSFAGRLEADFTTDEGYGTFTFENLEGLPGETMATVYTDGPRTVAKYVGLVPGDPWIELPNDPVTDLTSSPTTSLRTLASHLEDVEEVESAGGNTVYRGEFDAAGLLEGLPGSQQAESAAALESLGTDAFPVDITVDDEGYVADVTYFIGSPDTEASAVEAVTRFEKFGEPVDIRAPEESQVTTFEELGVGAE